MEQLSADARSALPHNNGAGQSEEVTPAFVYLFGVGSGYIKIGIAKDVEVRRRELQTGNHEEVKVVHVERCADAKAAYLLEVEVHALLHPYRIRGEWFDVSPEQVLRAIAHAKEELAKPRRVEPLSLGADFDRAADWEPALRGDTPRRGQKRRGKQPLRKNDQSLLPVAEKLARQMGRASISMFQRQLRVGYERAARIYGELEEQGFFTEYGIGKIGASGRTID